VVVIVREILAVIKQAAQNFEGEKFNIRKLNELDITNSIRLILETSLQLWRTKVMRRT
jgi:hypothetical protein